MAGDEALLRRCLDFELARYLKVSERVDRYAWGHAFLNPSLDQVWDANCIVVERSGMTAMEMACAADEAIGSAGIRHRTVVVLGDPDPRRLVPEFESLGWESEPGVYMEWRGAPDHDSEIEVAECRAAAVEDLRRRLISAELAAMGQNGEGLVDQLLEWDRRIGKVDGDRWFVAPADGEPASVCRLLARGGVGQVEAVGTLTERREQGLARAVTVAAARASKHHGNDLTYLGAMANDWPRLLYAKLGFEELGYVYEFKRNPQKARS
jgi:ribosomal protein S18 acetylase RimI-like enzyme